MTERRNFVRRNELSEDAADGGEGLLPGSDEKNTMRKQLETLEKLRENCEKILSCIDQAETTIHGFLNGIGGNSLDVTAATLQSCSARINGYLSAAYCGSIAPDFSELNKADREKTVENYLNFAENTLGFKCFTEPDSLEICMPMLPVRTLRSYGKALHSSCDSRLGAPLETVLHKQSADDRLFNDRRYDSKTVHFFFIYSAKEKQIPDSDNHDTKNVQDVICSCFRTGDSGKTTQTFLTTGITDLIPQRTYIRVTPSDSGIYTVANLIRYWQEKESCGRDEKI